MVKNFLLNFIFHRVKSSIAEIFNFCEKKLELSLHLIFCETFK